MRRFLILLMVFFVPQVYSDVIFEISHLRKGKISLDQIEQENSWVWTTKEDNIKVLGIELKLKSKEFLKFKKAKIIPSASKVFIKNGKLSAKINSIKSGIILLGNNEKELFKIKLKNQKNSVIDNNCRNYNLVLNPIQKNIPFYIGTSCEKSANTTYFTISFPHGVDLLDSTLFETKGKGEKWRYYELGGGVWGSKTIGKFIFSYKGKSYEFNLESLLESSQKKESVLITAFGGLGVSFLEIKGEDLSVSEPKPALVIRIPHFPLWLFKIGLNIDLSLPVGNTNLIKFSQLELLGAYEINFGKRLKIRPKVGYVLSSTFHDESGISLNANLILLGISSSFLIGDKIHLLIDFGTCKFSSQQLKSHYLVDINLLIKTAHSIGFGIGGKLQSFSSVNETLIKRNFNQAILYINAVF